MIIWLTGNSGSGKTTLAKAFKIINDKEWIHLDGDEMRKSISIDLGLSPNDREAHNLRIARLAKILHDQGFNILVSVIAPFQSIRDKIGIIIPVKWVYVKRILPKRDNYPYEDPNCFTLPIDYMSIDEVANKLDDQYWNWYNERE